MRRILLLYILLSVIGLTTVHAQFDNGRQRVDENGYDQYGNQVDPAMIPDRLDSANVEVQGLPPKLYMWRIKNQLGDRTIIPADTAFHHFQNSNLTEGLTGHYNYLANMGSPRMSRIFFDRRDPEPTIFMKPFSSFTSKISICGESYSFFLILLTSLSYFVLCYSVNLNLVPAILFTRSRISLAALLVKVIARIFHGFTPFSSIK